MTLDRLKELLDTLNIPVAYHHFNSPTAPPFIAYYRESTSNTFADNKVQQKFENITIELYTEKKDIELENKLETLLNDNELPYEIGEFFIDTENLYQVSYGITILASEEETMPSI